MEKYITTYRNDSTRLKNRDYGAPEIISLRYAHKIAKIILVMWNGTPM